jgi:hypothetical protein
MTALRTTPEMSERPARRAGQGSALSCLATFGFGLLLLGLFGCGHEPRETGPDDPAAVEAKPFASDRPLMSTLPPPRAEWIDYSAKDRKLSLYQLRASGRWMVKRPDRETAYPVGPEHVLPEGIDSSETYVFYIRPSGQTSRSITLAEIQAATREHLSIDR